jgi:hypothetical protein
MERPTVGAVYFAPIHIATHQPLIMGERRGIIVDEPSQDCAVVYSTREAAAEALADPATWHPVNAAKYRIARVRYLGGSFAFADADEREAHTDAREFEYCARCAAPHLSVDACEVCNHVCSARCSQRIIAKRELRIRQLPYAGANFVTR